MTRRSPYRKSDVRQALKEHKAYLLMLIKERDTRWEHFYSLCVGREAEVPLRLAMHRWETIFDRVVRLEKRIFEYEQRERDAMTP